MKIKFLLPFYFVPLVLNAQTKNIPTDNPLANDFDQLVHKEVSAYMKDPARVGLSIGIIRNGKSYFYNYGTTKKEKEELPTSKDVYEIASISKTFTGTLLAHALVDKKVNLDDDIRKYLDGDYPNLEFKKHAIKVAHLTNHSSGLPQFVPDQSANFKKPMDSIPFILTEVYKNYSRKKFAEDLHAIKIDAIPGTTYKYSNAGVQIIGDILEKVYHKSFQNLLEEYITEPLNMKQTIVGTNSAQLLTGYNEKGKVMPRNTTSIMAPAGGIYSSTGDMVKYIQYHLNKNDKYVVTSHTPIVKSDGDEIGLLWRIHKYKDKNLSFWHTGGTFGFSSVCQIYPEKNMGIVILTNESDMSSQGKLQDIAENIYNSSKN
ncbi:serine hydrolase [Chryseobacterium sp. T16E-39]|uniref:serine hydrolase domain-containing protein n=1 Tax=Chryseobacterium sp. T16E-39 TaxID=2015076 RepID=UPI000B5B0E08|nr:serine hydrolase domain-containing protein [Chryseobacterium sp. T16E-39]ASK30162.1 serine hydrolase [Chryseobacterium sp. T16E-39]